MNDAVTINDGPEAGLKTGTDEVYVTSGYFDTLKIPMLQGRDFSGRMDRTRNQLRSSTGRSRRSFFPGLIRLDTL